MRKNFKHGKWVKAPVPHADIGKYVDRQTGKEDDDKPGSRVRKEGSTMKFKKPKKGRGPSTQRKAGRAAFRGGGRTNLLEELGRVEGEHSNRNRRAEISRVHGELNRGYKEGGAVTRFRSSGEEGKPHSTKEGRSAEAQRAYMRKFGPRPPRRKRIWPKRAEHGLGSIVKKIITKIKPKPKGKGLGSGIKPSESKDILKSDNITRAEYLREYSPYFGGRRIKGEKAPNTDILTSPKGKKKTKDMIDKLKKKYPGGFKAKGGRIRKGHGGSAMQQHYLQHGFGPTKAKLRTGKPKIAKKGWA